MTKRNKSREETLTMLVVAQHLERRLHRRRRRGAAARFAAEGVALEVDGVAACGAVVQDLGAGAHTRATSLHVKEPAAAAGGAVGRAAV